MSSNLFLNEIMDLYLKDGANINILNFDEECKKDLLTGNGFIINETIYTKKKGKMPFGIQSSLFGSDWDDESSLKERYKCDCGEIKGKAFEGELCLACNTYVKYREVNYNIFGYIVINNYTVIQPLLYKMLETAIGKGALTDIITVDNPKPRKKKYTKGKSKTKVKTPFYGIGLIEFEKRYIEIMLYYKRKSKDKAELINFLLNNRKKVFTHSIPVFSSALRPCMLQGDLLRYSEIDQSYNPIATSVKRINKNNSPLDLTMNTYRLSRVQCKLNEVWDKTFDVINQKDGFIKDQILGGRLNYSARNVIIPDPQLRSDQVIVGYKCFMELYKQELISIITKTKNITENESHALWYKAMIEFDDTFYQAMKHIIKKFDPCILLNRNPTINYGSLICVDIIDVTSDIDDYTMRLSAQTLTEFNADFDGDIMNITVLKSKDIKKIFRKAYNPRFNMNISRSNGKFNRAYGLLKDQLIGLREFNKI